MSDFFEMMERFKYEEYVQKVSERTVALYGFHAQQAYPKTTEFIALDCYEQEDTPEAAAHAIGEYLNAPELLQ